MPFYQRLGDVPRKRHIQFRDNGTLLTEEVMGLEGFTGNESILYHLQSPCRVKELGPFQPIVREEWVPDAHAHRHFQTYDVAPGGDAVTGRRLLMFNNDVEIALCRPTEPMEHFYRNGAGDEVIFVHEGSGTFETIALWPAMAVVDRHHPDRRDGTWPPLLTNGRAFALTAAGHLVFGAVLGALVDSD